MGKNDAAFWTVTAVESQPELQRAWSRCFLLLPHVSVAQAGWSGADSGSWYSHRGVDATSYTTHA